ncbi:MAG: kelch repeat-containing protein [Maribacter sp.]
MLNKNKTFKNLYVFSILIIGIVIQFYGCADKKKEATGWEQVIASDGSNPIARHEAAFVRVKDKFYLLGGRGIRPVSIYDINTNAWTTGKEPPIEMHHFQPIVYKDKIYIFGAMSGKYPGEIPVSNIYWYDPLTDKWSQGDEIPEERRRGSSGNVLQGNKVFMSCGILDGHRGDHKKWLDSYDFETGVWEVLNDAPRARDHFQAVLVDGKIYNMAGRLSNAPDNTFNQTLSEVDVFDISEGKWKTLVTEIPTKRAGNTIISKGKEIWIVGGESVAQETAHSEVEILDTKTNTWIIGPPLLRGRHGTGIVNHEGSFYIASGCGNRGGRPELQTMEKLTY